MDWTWLKLFIFLVSMVVLTCSDACKPYFLRQPHTILLLKYHPLLSPLKSWQIDRRLLLLNLIAMASAPPEDYQLTTPTLSTALSSLSAPSALQRASAYNLDVSADALSEFDADACAEIDWKRLLGYHIPNLPYWRRMETWIRKVKRRQINRQSNR